MFITFQCKDSKYCIITFKKSIIHHFVLVLRPAENTAIFFAPGRSVTAVQPTVSLIQHSVHMSRSVL